MKKLLSLISVVLVLLYAQTAFSAIGDAKVACASVATTAFLDVQPASGESWVVHQIMFAANVELQMYNGTDSSIFLTIIGPDFQNFIPALHLDNTTRLRVQNLDVSSQVICYSGVQVK